MADMKPTEIELESARQSEMPEAIDTRTEKQVIQKIDLVVLPLVSNIHSWCRKQSYGNAC